jgi:thiol-disulfide isomerase/thioredoxin
MATEGLPGALGEKMPQFSLSEVSSGQTFDSRTLDAPVLVVMFICNHCPYVKAVEDRVIALAREYDPRGVAFVAICANDAAAYPDDAPPALAARAREKGYGFPYLHDASQAVAHAFGAVCTPEFYVYNAERRLVYRGRLDDSWKEPSKVTRRELALALDATLAGRPIEGPQRPSLGCSIKWSGG